MEAALNEGAAQIAQAFGISIEEAKLILAERSAVLWAQEKNKE